MAKNQLGIKNKQNLSNILINFSNQVHPLTLGQVYRSKSQIQMLAKRLLTHQKLNKDKENEIINFLCSESGSHDYTMDRKEAKALGVNVEKPNDELYDIIKSVHQDIEAELKLNEPFDPKVLLGNANSYAYSFRRALIESLSGGCDVFVSEGTLIKQTIAAGPVPVQQTIVQDNRQFEGWKHEKLE